jgi:hypothetical protein
MHVIGEEFREIQLYQESRRFGDKKAYTGSQFF